MAERPFRHVYILGAGFSYAMGGPLFTELLTQQMTQRTANLNLSGLETLPHHLKEMYSSIPTIFENLTRTSENPVYRGSYPGMNVEQFVERCDAAANSRQPRFAGSVLDGITSIWQYLAPFRDKQDLSEPMKEFVNVLKFRLSLETSAFLYENIDQSERWDPYLAWFRRLGPSDVIITTNYDGLIESIARKCEDSFHALREKTPINEYFDVMRGNGRLPVLCKLHGSADWFIENEMAFTQPIEYTFPDWGKEVLIGVPGSSKISLEEGVLRQIWDYAFDAVKTADFISIVGYSMPETDNRLRTRLLDSVAANCKNLKEINIVLGGKSERAERAKMILEQAVRSRPQELLPTEVNPSGVWVVKRAPVNLLPIYAQDFLPRFVPRNDNEYERVRFSE
jgi:hypothetical protein